MRGLTRTSLGDQLIRTVKLLHQLRGQLPRIHPQIDPMAYPLLARLHEEPRRLSALAEAVHLDTSTVSRQISTLVDLGLVDRAPDPADGRATVLSLSHEGTGLFAEVKRRRDTLLAEIHHDWSAADLDTLTTLLARFGDDIERYRDHLPTKESR